MSHVIITRSGSRVFYGPSKEVNDSAFHIIDTPPQQKHNLSILLPRRRQNPHRLEHSSYTICRGFVSAGKLAALAFANEAAPRKGCTSSRAATRRLKDEGSRLQVISAGAVAGLVSRFIVAPLDVVKIRLQLQPYSLSDPLTPLRSTPAYHGTVATLKRILQHEGLTALWKGNVPAELMYVCYASIQFSAYRTTTLLLQTALPTRLPDAAESFIAGASSGALATAITYPLDLLRTRFAAQGRTRIYSSLRGAVRDIRRDEGYRGFFRGIGPGLAQIVPYMGLFFVTYEGLRMQLAGLNMPWGSGDATAGVMGSVVAKTVVFPLDLVRKRIQVQGPTRSRYVYGDIPEYSGTLRALSSIFRREGFRGLYKGLPVSLLKSAPAGAITVWTYERSLKILIGLESRSPEENV
ncbi:mitochondrial thiamine pyrophosphate transporter [Claviceps lovelessii]|nr:mitochondrial thiamine pyrophosphate transporter [Claviceps lovelessii]